MITKEQVIDYLEAKYAETKFEFFSLVSMFRHFGCEKKDIYPALEQLNKEGVIRRRNGLNAALVQYIRREEK